MYRSSLLRAAVLLAAAAGIAASTSGRVPDAVTLYVSPSGRDDASGLSLGDAFGTIERARDEIRALKRQGRISGPVTVYLRGGVYPVTEPLLLTPEDSGAETAPVTYSAYQDERPIIMGGRTLSGWKQEANGVWSADLPDVRSGAWRFRQLFVNGQLRLRARTPNEGFFRVAGFPDNDPNIHYHTDSQRFEFAPGDLNPNWTNLDDVEVIVYHFWTDSHLPIQHIDPATNIVTFRHKAGKVFTDDFTDEGARYLAENVYEALDEPGEWYLNRKTGRLSYIPLAR